MKTFITLMFSFLLGCEHLASQGVWDVPPRGQQDVRAVTGGGQRVKLDTNTPLSVLIGRLNGDWEEVPTLKAYWFGYTHDMYSIAAHDDEAIAPLLSFLKSTHSPHAKYGAILTLHLIGIDRRITGRFEEEFKNPRARDALLDCLADDSLRDNAMLMLIRDPWPSDVPRLMEVMSSSPSDCWTIVNGLFRYHLKNIPFHQAIADQLANKPVLFVRPEDYDSDQFFWDILESMKAVAGKSLVLEDGLLQKKLWGYSHIAFGGGYAGQEEEGFAKLLNDVVMSNPTFSYCNLGNRIQYFVDDGIVHICSSATAKIRWLKWWDTQSKEYKSELSKQRRGGNP